MLVRNLNSQAFSSPLVEKYGIEFSSFYTMQHRLSGYAKKLCCLLHWKIAFGSLLH